MYTILQLYISEQAGSLPIPAGVWHTPHLGTPWYRKNTGFHSAQLKPIKALLQLQHRAGNGEITAPTTPP